MKRITLLLLLLLPLATMAQNIKFDSLNDEFFRSWERLSAEYAAQSSADARLDSICQRVFYHFYDTTGKAKYLVLPAEVRIRVFDSSVMEKFDGDRHYYDHYNYGENGGKRNCRGKNGQDIVIKVPAGTIFKDLETGKVIIDMSGDNKRVVLIEGGKGGCGNQHYATSVMQAPKYAQPGQPSIELNIALELKVIADVGLLGFPNVGKSTLLSRVSNAKPEIANYHFTTINPHLGVVDYEDINGFVIADIPGLIEGASEGVGLGHDFLRHIERTKVMIHIVDAASTEGRDPVEDIYTINKELSNYNDDLAKRPQVIAANKVDSIYIADGEENPVDRIKREFEPKGIKVFPISAVSGEGLKELLYYVKDMLSKVDDSVIVFEQVLV